jgi:hypothetical protein
MRPRDLDPNDERVELARFGKEVEIFLDSAIGQFMMQRAQTVSEDATTQLVKHAHTLERDEIRNLQMLIGFGDSFKGWLTEAVMQGHAAIELLKEDDHGG